MGERETKSASSPWTWVHLQQPVAQAQTIGFFSSISTDVLDQEDQVMFLTKTAGSMFSNNDSHFFSKFTVGHLWYFPTWLITATVRLICPLLL